MTRARVFWTVAAGEGEIRAEMLPNAVAGQMLVRTLASGVSRGTESLIFAAHVPLSQHEAMRAPLMGGTFPFPVKYGYSAVGRAPDGRRVFVLHLHQDVFLAPEAMCVSIPDAVPTHRAVLAANMETALNLMWDAAPLAGERVLVIGAGVLGLLAAALLARIPAARVTVVDVNAARAPLARHYRCGFALPPEFGLAQRLHGATFAVEAAFPRGNLGRLAAADRYRPGEGGAAPRAGHARLQQPGRPPGAGRAPSAGRRYSARGRQ